MDIELEVRPVSKDGNWEGSTKVDGTNNGKLMVGDTMECCSYRAIAM